MPGTALVRRPTEAAAVARTADPTLPPLGRLLDLVVVARATCDRYGERHFGHLLDRHPDTH